MKGENFDFICFDTEDNSKELREAGKSGFDKQVTQIAAIRANGSRFYSGSTETTVANVNEFKKWLQAQPEKFIYAHNLQYDLGNLFKDDLTAVDKVMVGGRLIKANWGKKVFVDTFNYYNFTAKALGEAFDILKLETNSMATDKEYVFRDVEIIWQAMLFAWKIAFELGLSSLPSTIGGLSIKVWQAWGGQNYHDSTVMAQSEMDGKRGYFYGGRVELFKQRDESGQVAYVDINSLYPSVMLGDFPSVLEEMDTTKLPKHGLVRASVQVPESDLVVLPFRNESGMILYPWGEFTGCWTVPELLYAESQGTKITKILEVMGTNDCYQPYADFVNRLYEMRKICNTDAESLFFKLLMNNLYGRLSASGTIARTVWQNERNRTEGIPYGEKVLCSYQLPLAEETNWSHGAYVTAYGRIKLHEYMKKIGASRMIYCDTDSCIFDCHDGKMPFKVSTDLGQMKLEKCCSACGGGWKDNAKKKCCQLDGRKPLDFWGGAETFAPKMYRINQDFKAKGVPKRLAREFIEKGEVAFDLPFKLRESIRMYDRDMSTETKGRLSVWRPVTKKIRSGYERKELRGNKYFPCKVG